MRAKLEYASTVRSTWQNYLINDFENVQRHSAHYVCNDYDYTSSVSEMIDALKWETLEDQCVKASLLMFY